MFVNLVFDDYRTWNKGQELCTVHSISFPSSPAKLPQPVIEDSPPDSFSARRHIEGSLRLNRAFCQSSPRSADVSNYKTHRLVGFEYSVRTTLDSLRSLASLCHYSLSDQGPL